MLASGWGVGFAMINRLLGSNDRTVDMRLDKIEQGVEKILAEIKSGDERLNNHILEDAENFHKLDKKIDSMKLIGIFLVLIASSALGVKLYEVFGAV